MSHVLLVQGDARRVPLTDGSIQCCVTSPPYYGLRDYGATGQLGLERLHDCNGAFTGQSCGECFICHMRAVFQEVWRVLRSDGTLFVVIGDSYTGSSMGNGGGVRSTLVGTHHAPRTGATALVDFRRTPDLKQKNLCGIPQRLALALQADGWYWRQEIIWHKLNPMPENVQDRCTKAHEQVLLFSKAPRYFWDGEAIKETTLSHHREREKGNGESAVDTKMREHGSHCGTGANGRNARSVWSIASESFSGAHFATFPQALAERCIRAGTPQSGCCPQCRAPYGRQVERGESSWAARKAAGHDPRGYHVGDAVAHFAGNPCVAHLAPAGASTGGLGWVATRRTIGFAPTCSCLTHALADGCRDPHHMDWLTTPVPSMVLDPFAGAGTVPLVARALGRYGIGMDLSLEYLKLSRDRLGLTALDAWLFGERAPTVNYNDLPLFTKEPTA